MRERILITGPNGRVGKKIVPLLREQFALRLFDLNPPKPEGDDEVVQGDIREFDALRDACNGAAVMLHLAAVSDEDDFVTRLMPMNVLGVHNAFEAARQAKLRRVLFASTCQTVLNYGEGVHVTPEMPVRPYTMYAATKVFGEALARFYSDRHQMSIICIRIGFFQGYDSELLKTRQDLLDHWCSPNDLVQLISKSIQTDLQFGVFFGVSNNPGRFWDITNARELLGYEPIDDSARYRKSP